ncbi:RNA methyltransferase [Alteribacter lacisalsi]|uniref:RNA methyltransferase n=1 Tax=Alteribacter lacisalsi TaxID=2045244 RepID=A0A2W0HAN8_9BACI|nr:RNA methyltransferase [Alteribacter lacisalsi]PYZ98227.1 RNA methyltransferase [Alteribacter lacisalsi]
MNYLYTYAYTEEEHPLCQLEMRALFGCDTEEHILSSQKAMDPGRSPFIKERLDVYTKANSLSDIESYAASLPESGKTFKIEVLVSPDEETLRFRERKNIERQTGLKVKDRADLKNPDIHYGLTFHRGLWYFGRLHRGKPVWIEHQKRPFGYSTALNARVARTVVNIAVQDAPNGGTLIDPCCGIGTVLLEACSMGVDVRGSDRNPKVMYGSRKNLEYFGYEPPIELKDICDVTGNYDAAIIDMPYNLCSVMSLEDQELILSSARRFAKKAVIITIDPVEEAVRQAGFTISDRCTFFKNGSFSREVLVCN